MFWLLFFNSAAPIGSYVWFMWLTIPAFFIHQFEEYVWPGNFKKELNQIFSGQNEIDFPLNDKIAFIINRILGSWILLPLLIALGSVSLIIPLVAVAMTVINTLIHIVSSLRFKQYKAGLGVSIFLNLPLGLYILIGMGVDALIPAWQYALIIPLGIVLHFVMILPLLINYKTNKTKYLS